MPENRETPMGAITVLLQRLAEGDDGVLDDLFPLVYAELRNIARAQRRREGSSTTLDTTALLHEAYLRFAKSDQHLYSHRQHFFAVAAKAMRQILLDEAKRRRRIKHGGEMRRVSLPPEELRLDEQADFIIALDQGLKKLAQLDQRVREVVEYRFFGGLTEKETAEVIGVNERTVRRDWAKARAWLAIELNLNLGIS